MPAAKKRKKVLTVAGYVVVVLVTLSIFAPAGWLVTWRNPDGTHVIGAIAFVLVFLIGIAVGLICRTVLKLFGLTIWKDVDETNASDPSASIQ